MRVLGIETSCDETAVALVETNPWSTDILAQVVSSQIELHRPYGGVVPEMATREHLRNLPLLVPQVLQGRQPDARRDRRGGGDGRAGPGLVVADRPFVRAGAGRGVVEADGRRESSRGASLLAVHREPARGRVSVRRADRQRRPHAAGPCAGLGPLHQAGLDRGRRGGRGVRQGGEAARPAVSGRAGNRAGGDARETRRRSACRAVFRSATI